MKRFCLLGSSRGLGWATYQLLRSRYTDSHFLLVSRKIDKAQVPNVDSKTKIFAWDFSNPNSSPVFDEINVFDPTEIVYFAAGGPYGLYHNKSWDSHLWSLKVTLLFPAELLSYFMKLSSNENRILKSITLIGSSIAESKPDPGAASYSAGKHALLGLVSSLQAENFNPFVIKLFSPGYMATDLLPINSAPRKNERAVDPLIMAEDLINFIESTKLLKNY